MLVLLVVVVLLLAVVVVVLLLLLLTPLLRQGPLPAGDGVPRYEGLPLRGTYIRITPPQPPPAAGVCVWIPEAISAADPAVIDVSQLPSLATCLKLDPKNKQAVEAMKFAEAMLHKQHMAEQARQRG